MVSQGAFWLSFRTPAHQKYGAFSQLSPIKAAHAAPLESSSMPPVHPKMANPLEIALLALLGLLWGMPYALTKIALTTIPPITLVAARVALAAAVLWTIVLFMRCKIPARRDVVG